MMNTHAEKVLAGASFDVQNPLPLHVQVRQFLRGAIEEHFVDGQSFWTERLLTERLSVSRHTIRQALDELTREGLLVRQVPRGSFVRKTSVTSLGVIFEQVNSDFVSEMIQQLASQCIERDLSLQLYPLFGGTPLEELAGKLRHAPALERVVLLVGDERSRLKLYSLLSERGYQVISLDESKNESSIPYVTTDSAKAVQLAIEHFTALGHERITFLVNEPSDRTSVARKIKTCRRLFKERDLIEGRIVDCRTHTGESSFEKAYELMPSIWRGEARPTAIFTASDPGAWAALRWFAEQGVKVPKEISVMGYEGVKPDAFTHPPLTSVAHSLEEIARRALNELWIPGESHVHVEPHIILRQSTGTVPS